MQQKRSVLYLNDPMNGKIQNVQGLVFTENGSFLSQAQTALWNARKNSGWVCVAAEGAAAYIALALAAQLPVNRLALLNLPVNRPRLSRELNRMRAFARRNLALVVSEVLIAGAADRRGQSLARGLVNCDVCVVDKLQPGDFIAAWNLLCEKNLLIPGKCV